MMICVVATEWGEGGVEAQGRAVLEAGAVPRIAVEAGRLWADCRGVQLGKVLAELPRVVQQAGARGVCCGVAQTPIAAWAAASTANAAPRAETESAADTVSTADDGDTRVVEAGTDRAFLATLGLECLEPEDRLRALLEGVGIVTCGQLAEVPREAIEVRFGGEAATVWRLARAEDRRTLFGALPPERPHASLDFIDYVVTDTEQLLFTANALIGNLCGQLKERGEHARALRLDLPLANGACWSRMLRPARPTASRTVWLRLARSVLERLTIPDTVTGVELRVKATEAASSVQGDLFDAGFATAGAVDAALARLLETQGPVLVRPEPVAHPLPERGTRFAPVELHDQEKRSTTPPPSSASLPPPPPSSHLPLPPVDAPRKHRTVGVGGGRWELGDGHGGNESGEGRPFSAAQLLRLPFSRLSPARRARTRPHPPSAAPVRPAEVQNPASGAAVPTELTLQLLPQARPVLVETTDRRDHLVPVRYRDGRWVQLVTVAGPDRISGGAQEGPYAREYFRGVTADGTLVLIYRNALKGSWYLHGWWD